MQERYGLVEIRGLIPELEYYIQGARRPDESLVKVLQDAGHRGVDLDWRRLNQILSLIASKQSFGVPPVPTEIIDFLRVYLQEKPAIRMLDPWAEAGVLVCALTEAGNVTSAMGVAESSITESMARLISRGLPVTWAQRSLTRPAKLEQPLMDVLMSIPPYSTGLHNALVTVDGENGTTRATVSATTAGLTQLLPCLADKGTVIIVVPDSFLDPEGQDRRVLRENALYINSVIALPARLFPWTRVPQSIAFMTRRQTAKIFAGRLTIEVDPKPLVMNLIKRRRGDLPELGLLVDAQEFQSWASVVAAEHLTRLAQRSGVRPIQLERVVKDIRSGTSHEEDQDSRESVVYLPITSKGPAVTVLDDDADPSRYLRLIVNEAEVIPEYLAYFYNSPLGLVVLESLYSGVVQPRLSRSSLRNSAVYLPSVQSQREVVLLDRQIQLLKVHLSNIDTQLAGSPSKHRRIKRELAKYAPKDGLEDWVEVLPFPLGSILWSYQASTVAAVRKQRLLHFFEAIAQFLAVIAMSAARRSDAVWFEARRELQQSIHLDRADFGTWIAIWSNLAKKLRALSTQPELQTELIGVSDRAVVTSLLSRNLQSILQKANKLRNDWKGHDFAVTDEIERDQVRQLETLLYDVQALLEDTFANLRVLRPKQTRGRHGAFRITAELLTGTRSPFREQEILLTTFLDEDTLYLWEVDSVNPLPLVPLLRIRPAPAGAVNACYFYSRVSQGKVRWVAYHLVGEPETYTEDADVFGLVRELAGGGQ